MGGYYPHIFADSPPLLKGAVTEGDWGILFKLKVDS